MSCFLPLVIVVIEILHFFGVFHSLSSSFVVYRKKEWASLVHSAHQWDWKLDWIAVRRRNRNHFTPQFFLSTISFKSSTDWVSIFISKWYGPFGVVITWVSCIVISHLTGGQDLNALDLNLLAPCIKNLLPKKYRHTQLQVLTIKPVDDALDGDKDQPNGQNPRNELTSLKELL